MNHLNDEQVDTLLREIADVDVPEPSPLFWQQFGTRVNAAIDAAEPRRRWLTIATIGWTTAAAAVCVAIAALFMIRSPSMHDAPTPAPVQAQTTAPAGTVAPLADVDPIDIDSDEAWAVVRTFAGEVHYDDARAAGVVPSAASIDRAATELPDDERAELVRLIQDDLRRTGA
jgi:hypothetical protein